MPTSFPASVLVLSTFWSALTNTAFAEGEVHLPPNHTPMMDVDFTNLPKESSVRPIASNGEPHHVQATLFTDKSTIAAGETLRLGIHLEQDEGWHTYWKSPGDIGRPTLITWAFEDQNGTELDDLIPSAHEYPIPTQFNQSGMVSYGYDDEVLLISTLKIPEDFDLNTVTAQATVEWLVCKESCIPGEATVRLPINVGTPSIPSGFEPVFEQVEKQHPTDPIDIKDFAVESTLSVDKVLPESKFTYVLQITPTTEQQFKIDPENPWPQFTPILGDWWMINEQSITPLSNGGFQVKIEAESFEAEPLPFTDRIGGLLQLQVGDKWIQTEVINAVELVPKDTPVAQIASPLLDTSIATLNTPEATAGSPTPDTSDSGTPEKSIFEALLLAFFGGMLLNIMPCVLPVLSLKLFGLIEQADITKRKQRIAGLAYTGGIIASFLALASAVIILQTMFGLNIGWGFQFQYPAYVIGLATIVFVFGLSMLGVFEVPTIGSSKAYELSQKEGWMEYFMIGVFATLLATPCSAPFLGTGIGFAFTLPPAGILLFFGIAGLGLAFPFLLIAFVPAFFKLLPQPGAWMETFKEIMGFTLIATTVWLVDVLGAQTGPAGVTGFLSFATVVALSAWIFGKWGSVIATTKAQVTSFLIAIGLSTIAGFFFLTTEFAEPAIAQELSSQEEMDFSEHVPWQPFSDENISALKDERKAIFIDFTADWCLSCKVNEKNVLETETIRNAMKSKGIIPVKADWTRRDESISRWLKEYGKAGVPFYLFIKSDGTTVPLPEVLTTNIVLEAFDS